MSEETGRGAPAAESETDKQAQPREKWANKMEFIFSMAGEIIGLGNVWRFPYLCYRNGGGAFLIPYFVFLFFCGIPVFLLETALGQYTSEGGVTAWRRICPMFQGVGFASQVIVIYLNIYYIVILAWALFYLINSFRSPLPWSTCDNAWNTDSCHSRSGVFANPELFHKESNWSFLNNLTFSDHDDNGSFLNFTLTESKSPEEEFWSGRVIRTSGGDLSKIHWDLALCLLFVWIVCYFCIWKGIKTTGKVVYFTATFPYLMLIILFVRGVTLPGAAEGLKLYLYPDFSKLANAQVWVDAGTQVFFSYAVCQGVLTALGSYNKYNNNCYRDCLALCCLNSATSIFAGFVVFSVLGFMAYDLQIPVSDLPVGGPGLAFIMYPRALALLPGSSFWAVLFFVMFLLLGLDSQFVCVESLATAITDLFPKRLRRRNARELLVLAIAVVCFLLGLPFVSEGGATLFQLVDAFGPSGTNLLIIAFTETVVIAWIYGADRFYDNIEDMIGYAPFSFLKYCWLFITPLICGCTLVYKLINEGGIYFQGDEVVSWSTPTAAFLLALPLLCIPLFIFISICQDPLNMSSPSKDLRQIRPHKAALTLCGLRVVRGQPRSNVKITMEEPGGV